MRSRATRRGDAGSVDQKVEGMVWGRSARTMMPWGVTVSLREARTSGVVERRWVPWSWRELMSGAI